MPERHGSDNVSSAEDSQASQSSNIRPKKTTSTSGDQLPITEFTVGTAFDATATSFISGDTIEINAAGDRFMRVRLYGIAAPKQGQPFHQQATSHLQQLIAQHDLQLYVRKVSDDGTLAVDVKIAAADLHGPDPLGVNLPPIRINNQMVKTGMAWHNPNDAPDDNALADKQRQAKLKTLGLWSAGEPPVAPWYWNPESQ